MSVPKTLLLDEPSLGLAPRLVDEIFEIIGKINELGISILLVERNGARALELALTAMFWKGIAIKRYKLANHRTRRGQGY
jgi:ABC-type branched-subunit amino acid transport system ATPase component